MMMMKDHVSNSENVIRTMRSNYLRFTIRSIHIKSNPTMCLTKQDASKLILKNCDTEMNINQMFVYDVFSKDMLLRLKGMKVLSTEDNKSPSRMIDLKIETKDFELTNGAQSWSIEFMP